MAIVKTLIVKGVARFLTDAYMSTIRSGIWNGSTIQVGYGGTGVTSAKGDLYTPVFLSSSGIAACTVSIPHNTKDFKINGTTYSIFTTYTGTAPTIFAPTTLAGTGGYILATNAAKTGFEWVAANNHTHSLYVLLDAGASELTIKNSWSTTLDKGSIEIWRALDNGYTMIGFANGASSKTKLGLIGFGSEANKPIFRDTSAHDYLIAHAGNITTPSDTSVTWNTEKTIATIAGVEVKIKIPSNPNSNTWRNIYTGGTSRVGTGTGTKAMNFAVAGNLSVNYLAAGTGSGQSGSADYFTVKITANANAVGVAGYVAAPTKASNPNQVWMTNSDGAPAWRTINVSTAATLLAKVSKSLKVDTWTDMGAVSSYTGTYAIQISSGNVYASGIFTACGGTDSVIDEIPLHVADKGTNTWRPYARISAGQLQMTTNEATGTSREYTIKILKLI